MTLKDRVEEHLVKHVLTLVDLRVRNRNDACIMYLKRFINDEVEGTIKRYFRQEGLKIRIAHTAHTIHNHLQNIIVKKYY